MGDRISIQFINGDNKSVVLFAHHYGKDLLESAKHFIAKIEEDDDSKDFPLGRLEVNSVMFYFCSYICSANSYITDGNYYLGKDSEDGDNSDNGHYIFNLKTKTIKRG